MGQCQRKGVEEDYRRPYNTLLFKSGQYGELEASQKLNHSLQKIPILKSQGFLDNDQYHLELKIICHHEFWLQIGLIDEFDDKICRQKVIDEIIRILITDGLITNKEEFWVYFEVDRLVFDRLPLIKINTLEEFNHLSLEDKIRIVGSNPLVTTCNSRGRRYCSARVDDQLIKFHGIYTWGCAYLGQVHVSMNVMTEEKYWKDFDLSNESTRLDVVKTQIAKQLISVGILQTVNEIDIYFNFEITFNHIIKHYID